MYDLLKKQVANDFKTFGYRIIIVVAANVVFSLVFLFLYYVYIDDFYSSGAYIIGGSYIAAILVSLILLFPKRNDPNYTVYYLSDPRRFSKFSKRVIMAGILLAVILYFYAQCNAYSQRFSARCVRGILDGSMKKTYWPD